MEESRALSEAIAVYWVYMDNCLCLKQAKREIMFLSTYKNLIIFAAITQKVIYLILNTKRMLTKHKDVKVLTLYYTHEENATEASKCCTFLSGVNIDIHFFNLRFHYTETLHIICIYLSGQHPSRLYSYNI